MFGLSTYSQAPYSSLGTVIGVDVFGNARIIKDILSLNQLNCINILIKE
jgi:hypothetical protein